jgi:hypothetical protein
MIQYGSYKYDVKEITHSSNEMNFIELLYEVMFFFKQEKNVLGTTHNIRNATSETLICS